ncbi:MAG: CsbD family protein [Chloroflexota bacterium]|nr:CsbD family protein [Chloroflexota bacterium]
MSAGLWDRIAGGWKQMTGEVKKQWGDLTDDEIMEINGNKDVMVGKIQAKYGIAKDEANRQIEEWSNKLKF